MHIVHILSYDQIVHGDHSLKVAESMQNLATILDSQGHLREAEDLLEKSLDIQKELAGPNSPEAAVSMNNLGVLCTHLGACVLCFVSYPNYY
jgi:hypothetical protein